MSENNKQKITEKDQDKEVESVASKNDNNQEKKRVNC